MPLFKCSASKAKPKNGIAYITDEKKAKIILYLTNHKLYAIILLSNALEY